MKLKGWQAVLVVQFVAFFIHGYTSARADEPNNISSDISKLLAEQIEMNVGLMQADVLLVEEIVGLKAELAALKARVEKLEECECSKSSPPCQGEDCWQLGLEYTNDTEKNNWQIWRPEWHLGEKNKYHNYNTQDKYGNPEICNCFFDDDDLCFCEAVE